MPLTVSNFLIGPLIAFAVIGLLAAGLHWMLGREPIGLDAVAPPPLRLPGDDYGLLRAAAVAETRAGAESIRTLLNSAGIRATLATGEDGRVRVLVFEEELDRARRVMG